MPVQVLGQGSAASPVILSGPCSLREVKVPEIQQQIKGIYHEPDPLD